MTDPDRERHDAFDRRELLALLGVSGVGAFAGCVGRGAGTGTSDGAAGTDGGEATTGATETSTDEAEDGTRTSADTPESADDPLGPLPTPERDGVPEPSGEPGGLVVLDWAGFESAVAYTFDDGQPSQVDHYEAIQDTGVDTTFYVSSNVDFPGSEQGWRRAVADGHEIGNHTVSHPHANLTGSSFGEPLGSKLAEVRRCSEYIVRNFDQPDVWTMAAPFGEDEWIEAARQADVFLNRGVGGGTVAPNDDTDRYDLPCYMARAGETAETFNDLIDSARSDGEWLIFLFHTVDPTDEDWYAPVDVSEITESIAHAKSFSDVWIGTVAKIGAYWLGERIVSSAERTTSGAETVWTWTLPDDFPPGQHVRVCVDGGTLTQGGDALEWDSHGYYEVALDEESLTLAP